MPRQPEPSKTTLISSSDTPKSERMRTPMPAAIASRAAVEDTVTRAAADSRAAPMAPVLKRSASLDAVPAATSSAHSSG